MTKIGVNKLIEDVKRKLDVIASEEREIVKGFLWDLYAEQGMHPHQMRLAFNEVITAIEEEERKYELGMEVERND